METERTEVLSIIGQNIKAARLLNGLTQEVLSEKISKSTNFVSLIERGSCGCSLTTLVDICNVLGVDVSVIFNGLITNNANADNVAKSLSMLKGEDRAIVDNLITYIVNSKN